MKRGKGRDMAAEYAAVREILKPYVGRAEAAEKDRDEWKRLAHVEANETCTRAHLQDRMAKLREALVAYDKLSLVIESAVRERRDRDSREEGNYELLLRVIAQARAALRGGGK